MMKKFPESDFGKINSLQGVEVGDVFMLDCKRRFGRLTDYKIVKCERITPKQVVIDGDYYRINDASRVGGYSSAYGSPPQLENYDEEKYKKAKQLIVVQNGRTVLAQLHWCKPEALTDEVILKVYEILKATE